MRALHFYFDYISPYAYLAAQRIAPVLAPADVEVVPVPVLFAGLLDHWGSKGPAEIAPKRNFMFKDVLRKAKRWNVPLSLPPYHPFNPLLALRVTVAVHSPVAQQALMGSLFASAWQRGEHLEDPQVVSAAIERVGLPARELLDAAASPGTKDLLRAHTRAAVARGIFGVPSFAIDNEVFWGSDVFDDVLAYIEGRDPVPADFFRELVKLRPSAVRKKSKV